MRRLNDPFRRPSRRRGSAYIAILGISLVVMTLAVAGITAARVQARAAGSSSDMSAARLNAQSGLELARLWIAQDPNWRTNRAAGTWASNLAVGDGAVTIDVADPSDGNLANRPHDPVRIIATGTKGQATHVLRLTLTANPVPMPILQYALTSGGNPRIRSSRTLSLGAATMSVNGSLRNENVIEGNVECQSINTAGIIHGVLSTAVSSKPMPASTIAESYASLGTLINTTSIDRRVLSPGVNPWGAANSDGVYVIRSSSDITLKNSRINGTLVVICPGKKLTVDNSVYVHPARADFPSLIVNGDIEFRFTTSAALSEAGNSTNFNPPGAPYNGMSDIDLLDTYPSEIRGLVHVTGTVKVSGAGLIRGALISAENSTDSVDVDGNFTIVHDPALWSNPPQFYTTSVPMPALAGSMQQIVN
jgi:hypothetical protein